MKILIVVLSVLFGVTNIFAQNVEDIIQKSLATRGSTSDYKNIKSIKIVGKIIQAGMTSQFVYYLKDNIKCRFELEMMGSKTLMAFNGDSLMVSAQGQTNGIPKNQTDAYLGQMQQIDKMLRGPFFDYIEKGQKIEFSGNVTEDGRESYTLMLKDDGAESYLYVDKNNYELFKVFVSVPDGQGGQVDIEMKFSNFTKVSGIAFPFKVSLNAGSYGTSEYEITSIEANPVIDDSLFVLK